MVVVVKRRQMTFLGQSICVCVASRPQLSDRDLVSEHSVHIVDQASFVASLAKGDPQKALAEEHARHCVLCRKALDEGARFISMLKRALSSSVTTGGLPRGGAA